MLRRTSAILGLDRTILLMAATHFAVDGYSNIYAPLLPLLIPRLDLSLAAAGALTMCFQIAASVSQLAFGHLADRWRPRVLLIAGPILAVSVLSLVGPAPNVWALAAVLIVGGLPPIERLHEQHERGGFSALRPYAKPLTLLYLIVVLRTMTAISFSTFMPVMLTRRGMTVSEAGGAVAFYLFAASLGGFLGGPLADV